MRSPETVRTRELVLGGLVVAALLAWVGFARALAGPQGHGFAGIHDALLVGQDRWHGLADGRLRWCLETTRGEMWRPLFWFALAAEHGLASDAATAVHIASALLHAMAFVLVALATGAAVGPAARTPGRIAGLAVAAVWCLHPLRVEPVACASQQGTLLGAVLLGTAAFLWLATLDGPGWQYGRTATAAALTICSVVADPTLCLAPLALLALVPWAQRRSPHPPSGRGPAMGVAAALGVVFLVATLSRREAGGGTPALAVTLASASALVRPLRSTLWPSGLHPAYDPPAGFPDGVPPSLWVDAATAAALVLACGWYVRRRHGLGYALLAYLTLAAGPVLLRRAPVGADADAYVATIPLFVAGGVIVARWCDASPGRRRPLAACAGIAAVVGLAAADSDRDVDGWKDEQTIARRTLEIDPANETALVASGDAARRSGAAVNEFVHWYGRALEHDDARPLAHARLGGALLQTGDAAGARRHLERAVLLAPWLPSARFDLGALEMSEGHLDAARVQLEAAARLDAESAETWRLLAQARDSAGDRDGAIDAIGRASELLPGDVAIEAQARRLAR